MPRLRPLHVVAQHTDQRQDRVLVSEPRRRGHEQLAGDDLVATAVGWERPHLVRRPIVRGLRHAHSLLGSAEERQEDTGDDGARRKLLGDAAGSGTGPAYSTLIDLAGLTLDNFFP